MPPIFYFVVSFNGVRVRIRKIIMRKSRANGNGFATFVQIAGSKIRSRNFIPSFRPIALIDHQDHNKRPRRDYLRTFVIKILLLAHFQMLLFMTMRDNFPVSFLPFLSVTFLVRSIMISA